MAALGRSRLKGSPYVDSFKSCRTSTKKFQPGRNPDDAAEDEAANEELRREAARHAGFDDEGRPVKDPPVEPDVSEEESKIAEESGETGATRR